MSLYARTRQCRACNKGATPEVRCYQTGSGFWLCLACIKALNDYVDWLAQRSAEI